MQVGSTHIFPKKESYLVTLEEKLQAVGVCQSPSSNNIAV